VTDEAELIALLAAAARHGRADVDATLFADLDRAAAYRVQIGVMAALNERVGMLKTAVAADGTGVAAPIYESRIGRSQAFSVPAAQVLGIELEVALVLGRDLSVAAATSDPASVTDAMSHHVLGLELCSTRFRDRKAARNHAGLADGMSAFGYVIDPAPRELGAQIDGFDVEITHNGTVIHAAPAQHSFGTVLASFDAYARAQHPDLTLAAGLTVTTGSLCGLVPLPGPGLVVARLGTHSVTCLFT
jgi:2-keto-4-pentenoate hydratase